MLPVSSRARTHQVRGIASQELLRFERIPDERSVRVLRVEHGLLQQLLALIVALLAECDTLTERIGAARQTIGQQLGSVARTWAFSSTE